MVLVGISGSGFGVAAPVLGQLALLQALNQGGSGLWAGEVSGLWELCTVC